MQPIFIGDVQGCAEELEELIDRARATFGEAGFELWLVGDLVNRGPESLRVLHTVRYWADRGRARAVLGNHDVRLLRVALGLSAPRPKDTTADVLESPQSAEWVEWLRRRRLVEVGRLGECPFALVHAAVPPDWPFQKLVRCARRVEGGLGGEDLDAARALLAADRSDPDRDLLDRLTCCRAVDRSGVWSEEEPRDPADAWHRRWRAAAPAYGVVYGHWSRQGLHVAPGIRGLDTGCVHHGRGRDGFLTAWLPDLSRADPFALPDDGFWQVPARRRYYGAQEGSPNSQFP